MAAFLQDDRGGKPVISPVAPDEGMGHMEIADILRMFDGNDLAKLTAVDDLLQLAPKVCVPQNMTDGDLFAQGIGFFLDGQTFPGVRGDGLLQQDIVAAAKRLHYMAVMIPVHGCDDGGIGDLSQSEKLIRIGKTPLFGDIPLLSGFC